MNTRKRTFQEVDPRFEDPGGPAGYQVLEVLRNGEEDGIKTFDAISTDGDRVIIKQYSKRVFQGSQEIRHDLLMLRALKINQQCIDGLVCFHGMRESDENYYFFTSYIPGNDLTDLELDSWDNNELMELSLGIANLIETMHDNGIVHQNLKPSNIRSIDDKIWITDFHHSCLDSDDSPFVVECPAAVDPVVGWTPIHEDQYLTPNNYLEVASRFDVFSEALLIYYILTGRMLYSSEEEYGQPIPEGSIHSDPVIDAEFRNLLESMLADNPEDRPTSNEVFDRLIELKELESSAGGGFMIQR